MLNPKFRKYLNGVMALASKTNFRAIVILGITYLMIRMVIFDNIFRKITVEAQSENLANKVTNIVKESKETAQLIKNITRSMGLENLPTKYSMGMNKKPSLSTTVIKREDMPRLSHLRKIPLCGSSIEADIIGRNQKGDEFYNDTINFTLGNYSLPLALENGMHKITSGFKYDIISPVYELYFITQDIQSNLFKLKPMIGGSGMVSYTVAINKIDKSFDVGDFEPRIFYIVKGSGQEVVCNSSIEITLKITSLDGNVLANDVNYSINIGKNNVPYGFEHVLMRLVAGDKVSVMLPASWLKIEKKHPPKITFPTANYLIFDITVQNVKQPSILFQAIKPEIETVQ